MYGEGTSVDVPQAGGFKQLSHGVNVEAELAGGEPLAFALLKCLVFPAGLRYLAGTAGGDHHDAVDIGNDDIARVDQGDGAHEGNVD